MKRILSLACVGGLALATTALGGNRNHGNSGFAGAAGVHRSAPAVRSAAPAMSGRVMSARPTQRSFSRAPVQRSYVSTPRVRNNATVRNHAMVRSTAANARVRSNINASARRNGANATVRNNANARVRNNVTLNRNRTFTRNRAVNVGANFSAKRNRNAVVTNNWRGDQFRGRNYAAFRNYNRQWHDRGWWRHHYNRIVFVDNGWWYWNAGYWFPAWGYDASAYYPYDGPIYGYSNLSPDQVVVNVQTQLAREGYYTGPVDGVLGPMTRQAIASFQADNGLAITSTVDEPTLSTLGLS